MKKNFIRDIIGAEMKIIANNKKAFHDFFVSELVECGICLKGSEVKALRSGGCSLNDSFVQIKNGEAFLVNAYIKPYDKSSSFVPESKRTRKLLLHRVEILKLEKKSSEKGFTIIPTKIYFKNGLVKIEIGLAKGKKTYDKRESLKKATIQKEIERISKNLL